MDEHIVVRVMPDGAVHAETKNMKGTRCLESIELLEDLLDAATLTSAFTPEYHESTHTTTTEEADELHQR